MKAAKEGLHSVDWHSHLPCLLQLATLMRVWPGDKPLPLLQDKIPVEYTELDATVLENAVAQLATVFMLSIAGMKVCALITVRSFILLIVP